MGRSLGLTAYLFYYLFLVAWLVAHDLAVLELVTDWGHAYKLYFGMPLLGVYHLTLMLGVLGFNALIVTFLKYDLMRSVLLYLRLFFLDVLTIPVWVPLYYLVLGRPPLDSAREELIISSSLDEATLISSTLLIGSLGLYSTIYLMKKLPKYVAME